MKENKQHITQLDGLRFFAVTSVMFAHWILWKLPNEFIKHLPFTQGVTLFFVLSGFLITKILLENKDAVEAAKTNKFSLIKSFYVRRALRIFPVYYLLLLAAVAVNYTYARELFPWLASFTINIYQSIENIAVGDFNHFWSLAVEEQFYLFWPWLLLFTPRKHVVKLILALIIVSLCYKAYIFFYVFKWRAEEYFVLSCTDALALGALAAYLNAYFPKWAKKLASGVVCWLAVFLYAGSWVMMYFFHAEIFSAVFYEFLFALMAVFIVNRAAHQQFNYLAKYILQNKAVVYIGKISYAMYLYHLFIPFVYFYVKSKIGWHIDNLFLYFIILYASTFLLAHFSWILIENPINSLKNKFPYLKKEALKPL